LEDDVDVRAKIKEQRQKSKDKRAKTKEQRQQSKDNRAVFHIERRNNTLCEIFLCVLRVR
jgi:hypothetical protein